MNNYFLCVVKISDLEAKDGFSVEKCVICRNTYAEVAERLDKHYGDLLLSMNIEQLCQDSVLYIPNDDMDFVEALRKENEYNF